MSTASAGASTTGSGRSTVAGTRPAWASTSPDAGPAAGSARVDMRVWLSLRDPAGVAALVASVNDPSSPNYHHYLTPAQFDAAYAPTASQADAVASWLNSTGLAVTSVASNYRYVAASGSVAQVERALGVSLRNYNVRGQVWRAPANDPSAPSDIRSNILTITGLDTGDHSMHPASSSTFSPPPAFVNAPPLSTFYGQDSDGKSIAGSPTLPAFDGSAQPWVEQGYTPPQLRSAYGISGTGLTGTGTTVAIVDAYYSATMVQDANTYASRNDPSAPSLVAGSNYFESLPATFTNSGPCAANSWQGEETLDVEAVHGIAPNATIRYFGASSCNDPDLLDALTRVVEDGHANVISNSWSGLEAQTSAGTAAAYETVFSQAIAEGMTVAFSSGDDGDELAATGTKQVDYPSSDPLITSVGGTSIGIDSKGRFAGQDGWGTMKSTLNTTSNSWNTASFLYGAGGGCSVLFSEPAYQSGSAAAGNIGSACAGTGPNGTTGRGVPDIGLDADPNTGYLVGETQLFPHHVVSYGQYRIGGTSLACPLFSAMLALADQGHISIAQANQYLYRLTSGITDIQASRGILPNPANARADFVNGVDSSSGTVYSMRAFGHDSSLPVTAGWDQVTGLGSFNGGVYSALTKLAG
ncbi:MAG TPA: S53 family peptidase [Acidimicrobiales bacterium]|nr:S53 family peptidase [Acidimicrobiales bacterium]